SGACRVRPAPGPDRGRLYRCAHPARSGRCGHPGQYYRFSVVQNGIRANQTNLAHPINKQLLRKGGEQMLSKINETLLTAMAHFSARFNREDGQALAEYGLLL